MKPSLKSSLKLTLVYFLTLILGTLVTSMIDVIYETCMNLVAGDSSNLFDFSYFVHGVLITMPVVLILNNLVMVMFMIKHCGNQKLPVVFYYIFYLISWLVLMPGILYAGQKYAEKKAPVEKNVNLSSGYFRTEGDFTFYYTEISDDNLSSGIVINTSGEGENVYTFKNMVAPSDKEGFKDPLIEEAVKMNGFVQVLISGFFTIFDYARSVLINGYVSWLLFCFMGLSVAATVAFRNISRWKLLNLALITFITGVIISLNILVIYGKLFESANTAINNFFKFMPAGTNTFLIMINLLIFILFHPIGIAVSYSNKKKGIDD